MAALLQVVTIFGLLLIVAGAVQYAWNRRIGGYGSSALWVMGAGVILSSPTVFVPAFLRVMDFLLRAMGEPTSSMADRWDELLSTEQSQDRSPDATATGTPTPTPTPTPSPTPSPTTAPVDNAPDVIFDATPLIVVASVVLGLVLLSFIFLKFGPGFKAGVEQSRAEREKAAAAKEAARARLEADRLLWKGWLSDHTALNERFLAYEKDLELIATYPMMRDMSVPEVSAAYRAIATADTLRREEMPYFNQDSGQVDNLVFPKAVREAKVALDRAEMLARTKGTRSYDAASRKDLDLALKLVRLAKDSGASPGESASALRQAVRIIERVIGAVPKPAIKAIESAIEEKAIAAGTGPSKALTV